MICLFRKTQHTSSADLAGIPLTQGTIPRPSQYGGQGLFKLDLLENVSFPAPTDVENTSKERRRRSNKREVISTPKRVRKSDGELCTCRGAFIQLVTRGFCDITQELVNWDSLTACHCW